MHKLLRMTILYVNLEALQMLGLKCVIAADSEESGSESVDQDPSPVSSPEFSASSVIPVYCCWSNLE